MQGVSTELSLAERAVPPNPSEQLLQVGQRSTKSKANALLLQKAFLPAPGTDCTEQSVRVSATARPGTPPARH